MEMRRKTVLNEMCGDFDCNAKSILIPLHCSEKNRFLRQKTIKIKEDISVYGIDSKCLSAN